MSNRTVNALLSRGFPKDIAEKLSNNHTVSQLQQLRKEQLVALDIPAECINKLTSKRPPIPAEILNKILFMSRCTCCVCRKQNLPFVIHHIDPWEKSRSHAEDNLVLLCLNHHAAAHSHNEISMKLSSDRIKSLRNQWYDLVNKADQTVIQNLLIDSENACWDFFNVPRIFELVLATNIDLTKTKHFALLYKKGYVDRYGYFSENLQCDQSKQYWLSFFGGFFITSYMSDVLMELTKNIDFQLLNTIWTKTQITKHIQIGQFITLQGAFYFNRKSKIKNGINQICRGYRQYKGIRIEFNFDAWYSCSSTSYCCNLAGHVVKTIFAIVQNIVNSDNKLIINCRVLAIGSHLSSIEAGRGFL